MIAPSQAGGNMKSTISTRIIAATFFTLLAIPAQTIAQEQSTTQEDTPTRAHYTIVDLGKLGNPPGQPYFITSNGLIAGAAAIPDGAMHAALWYMGLKFDIGTPGLGAPNSAAFGINKRGHAVGEAETLEPNGEDFCGFKALGLPASGTSCAPFLWRYGTMTRLPTLGGANGIANMINNRGEAVGLAENKTQDKGCSVFQFKPVIWKDGKIHELPTFRGDRDGVAAQINDNGQVVGSSGACAPFNPNSGLNLVEKHALLWEKDGSVHDLGNLGGTGANAGNHACAINNRCQVVGHSELKGDTTFHGFLWTRETGMQDLGTLDGDVASLALSINDKGKVVGASLDANFNLRAVIWEHHEAIELKTLVGDNDSGLSLLLAASINSRGEIVGIGATNGGETHGFLAIPRDRDHDDCDSSENADCR
jgi:probable HAF family extracellular repeat protein